MPRSDGNKKPGDPGGPDAPIGQNGFGLPGTPSQKAITRQVKRQVVWKNYYETKKSIDELLEIFNFRLWRGHKTMEEKKIWIADYYSERAAEICAIIEDRTEKGKGGVHG